MTSRVWIAGLVCLCAKALDLPPDEGRRVRPRLIALSGSMEALSQALLARGAPSG